jgi:Transglycosylase SLT domain
MSVGPGRAGGPSAGAGGPPFRAGGPRGRRTAAQRRARLGVGLAGLILVVAVIVSGIGGGGLPRPPRGGTAAGASGESAFVYRPSQESEFVARATAGNANVLFTQSPGGVIATAARVAPYRPAIDRATAGTGIDPNLVEGLVFVESAGRPDAIAGSDPADAAGLTQILAQTGQSLLGMHIDLARSRKLSASIDAVAAGTRTGRLAPLLRRRAAVDDRFDPSKELAATVRYLRIAERQFGRQDLATESYHMGIGNLHNVLGAYNGGHPVPYAQLYFDCAPDHNAAAYKLLSEFGDDSWLYYWRVLGAVQVMRLYRTDRRALTRLTSEQTDGDAGASVMHPPGATSAFADPAALAAAYQRRELVPLPRNGAALGLSFDRGMGAEAAALSVPRALYRGLRPVALRFMIELAAQVRSLSGLRAPLRIAATVSDARYQSRAGISDPPATTGFSFEIERRYAGPAQAGALQELLDRLQSLNLIAWERQDTTIRLTVASDAVSWLERG